MIATTDEGESREFEGLVVSSSGDKVWIRCAPDWMPSQQDVRVAPRLVEQYQLRPGSLIKGTCSCAQRTQRLELTEVSEIDGEPVETSGARPKFDELERTDSGAMLDLGEATGDVSLRIMDLVCPIARGQRCAVVSPPESGSTTLLQKIAGAIDSQFEDVELLVLLVDERPEETTEWRNLVQRGSVFASNMDESFKNHVELTRVIESRCRRLVELGRDVFLIINSMTRLVRAFEACEGGQATGRPKYKPRGRRGRKRGAPNLQRPSPHAVEQAKQLFESAGSVVGAGSLTILSAFLLDQDVRSHRAIYDEFEGSADMELLLSSEFARKEIFPAIDIRGSHTHAQETSLGSDRTALMRTLRSSLVQLTPSDAMQSLVRKMLEIGTYAEFEKHIQDVVSQVEGS